MSNTLKNKILHDIEEKKISPKSSNYFRIREIILWSFGVLSLIFGGVSSSVLVFALMNHDIDIYQIIEHDFLRFILFTFPYLWVFSLVVFALIARYNIRHTKFGYRYRPYTVILSSIFISLVMGFILNGFGIGKVFDQFFIKYVPEYSQVMPGPHGIWLHPEEGRLIGRIVSVSENAIIIVDLRDREWVIDVSQLEPEVKSRLREGLVVKISGNSEEGLFRAEFVKPNGDDKGLYRRRVVK